MGFAYNDHVSQAFNYTLSDRSVNNLSTYASLFVQDEQGSTVLSQIGQTIAFDWRDSRLNPHSGFIVRLGTDFAGLGGSEKYVRGKIDSTFFLPLDYFTGNSSWGFSFSQGAGYLDTLGGKQLIIDRFFLGGDNLRGFLDQGAGPHSVAYSTCYDSVKLKNVPAPGPNGCPGAIGYTGSATNPYILYHGADPLGGDFIWTQSSEFHFPLPVPADFGLAGRAFVDMGGLSGLKPPTNTINGENAVTACIAALTVNKKGQTLDDHGHVIDKCYYDNGAIRLSVGVGVSWKSPFGLINIDFGIPILKEAYDQKQIFKFGFGTRFE
jgi:outer membrane protein insertion porin family